MRNRARRTSVDWTLTASALLGVPIALSHYVPLANLMLPVFVVVLIAPPLARRAELWWILAGIWGVASVVRRHEMEDHVYVYVAWLIALALSLHRPHAFVTEAGRQGRSIIAIVFGFATLWKIASGQFINGTALWTLGLFDDRMAPLMRTMGVSAGSQEAALGPVNELVSGDRSSYEIDLSSYSSLALIAVSVLTLLLEATIAVSHAAPDTSVLARVRMPALVLFGLATYSVVPVFLFAMILAVISAPVSGYDRRSLWAFRAMVAVAFIRFLSL